MFWFILYLLQLCTALPSPESRSSSAATIRQIYEFPNVTWAENLAVRSNGQLLVTLVTSPDVYLIDPFEPDSDAKLIAHFSDSTSVLGIDEVEKDVFVVSRGNFSIETFESVLGSFYISEIDMRGGGAPKISTIANIADGLFGNGLTTVEAGSNYLLLADSFTGVLWRINMETSVVDIALNSSATQPALPLPQGGIGINGVHTKDGYLYFTNFNLGYYRVPISSDGLPAGETEKIASFEDGDDFALAACGTAYITQGFDDAILKVAPSGTVTALEYTNSRPRVLVEGATATQFGRTKSDRDTLYVTTNGGLAGLVKGTEIQGGRVLAVDLA